MIKSFILFVVDIIKNRELLWRLSVNDIKSRFSASFLGIIWAFLQPLAMILVLWFVFQVGLKNEPVAGVPFILWLVPGFLIWNSIVESILSSANSIIDYKYLVKKVNFRVGIIPIVRVISAGVIHVAFVFFIVFLNLCYGKFPSLYYLQVLYYFFAVAVLLIGLAWLLAAVTPFVPDVYNITSVGMQIGFWATPIMWNPEIMPANIQLIVKLNPFYYICMGYRDTFVYNVWFWERGWINVYYWVFTASVFILGAIVFKRMRSQFADVL